MGYEKKYFQNEIPHEVDIIQPFNKWCKSHEGHNAVIFSDGDCDENGIHLSINHLKKRIAVRDEAGLSASKEAQALISLTCEKCVQQQCPFRTDECQWTLARRDMTEEIDNCVKNNLIPCGPYTYDEIEAMEPKIWLIETEYYFDVTPKLKKKAYFEIESKSRSRAELKAEQKWPNSTVTSSKEKQ